LNRSALPVDDVPPGVVTVTSTWPSAPPGVVAVIEVSLLTVAEVAETPPNSTLDSGENPVPVMVTGVPPVSGPAEGETAVTVGTGS
jgi:hypothetical protein